MKKYILSIIVGLTVLVGGGNFGGHALAATAPDPTAAAKLQACRAVNDQTGGNCGTASGINLSKVIRGVITLLSVIAGIAAVIMIIISGLKYITSNGDSQAVSSAKSTLIYAIVGLVVVAVAQFIVRFVLKNSA